jgi:hypothetical protein
MRRWPAAVGFLLGSTISAWLRFDGGFVGMSWIVMLLSIAAIAAGLLHQAKRVLPLRSSRLVQESYAGEDLNREPGKRFVQELGKHHSHQQREVWHRIQRLGPGTLIGPRVTRYYFWLCLVALAVLPPTVVPRDLMPQLPRFAFVLVPLAVVALAVAIPLGLRDWRRAVRSLGDSSAEA